MATPFASVAQYSVVAFTSIFSLVDPFATIPAFLAMTAHDDDHRRKRMAKRASLTCFIVLTLFAVLGTWIFRVFGITLPAFEIAGGLILLMIGLEMLQARRSATQEVAPERREAAEKEDVGITPLGIPMLAGPGAISTVMVLLGPEPELWQYAPVLLAVLFSSVVSYFVLKSAQHISKRLGQTGIRILVRLMGLLLTAIAVQFFLNGLHHLGALTRNG